MIYFFFTGVDEYEPSQLLDGLLRRRMYPAVFDQLETYNLML